MANGKCQSREKHCWRDDDEIRAACVKLIILPELKNKKSVILKEIKMFIIIDILKEGTPLKGVGSAF